MLNVEAVDEAKDIVTPSRNVEIIFTDSDADEVMRIQLTRKEARKLAEMIDKRLYKRRG
jgi:K+/H+ antiporter YhaU regulatory subunit KhtT